MTTPADMVTKAAVAIAAFADSAKPPKRRNMCRFAASIPPMRLMPRRAPALERGHAGYVYATQHPKSSALEHIPLRRNCRGDAHAGSVP